VGLTTLAVAVGEEATTVAEVCEPFLVRVGMLARTRQGRIATPAAWSHLGLEMGQAGRVGQVETAVASDPATLFDQT
jgi:Holliday junction DNA helicase RuvB